MSNTQTQTENQVETQQGRSLDDTIAALEATVTEKVDVAQDVAKATGLGSKLRSLAIKAGIGAAACVAIWIGFKIVAAVVLGFLSMLFHVVMIAAVVAAIAAVAYVVGKKIFF